MDFFVGFGAARDPVFAMCFTVALKRRDLDELLSEELRRLDPDDVYAATAKHMAKTGSRAAPKPTKRSTKKAATKATKKG